MRCLKHYRSERGNLRNSYGWNKFLEKGMKNGPHEENQINVALSANSTCILSTGIL